MKPIDWLTGNVPEFAALSGKERDVIQQFTLLWSLFESKALNTNASSACILKLAQKWEHDGRLKPQAFDSALAYFKDRYFENGHATKYFAGLHLRANDNAQLVEAVLKGQETKPSNVVAALLIIVFRLRNNLFHGIKWAYGIRGQFDNFANANNVLMAALEHL